MSKEPVFTKTVKFDDGTEETFARREQPVRLCEMKRVKHSRLFTACLPKEGPSRIIAQPIDHYLPSN